VGPRTKRARIVLVSSALGLSSEQLDARYARLAGVASGYLSKDRAAIDEWHEQLRGELRSAAATTTRMPDRRLPENRAVAGSIPALAISSLWRIVWR